MKIFISSLISGMEAERALAKKIIKRLGNDFVPAEDFPAQPNSPQIACLQGLRQSGLVVLILNEYYGAKQASGLSATHEEYREAKETRPINTNLRFVRDSIYACNTNSAVDHGPQRSHR